MKHQMRGATQAQQGMTLWITLMAANFRNRISMQAMRSRPHGVKGPPPFFFLGTLFLIINIFVGSSSPF